LISLAYFFDAFLFMHQLMMLNHQTNPEQFMSFGSWQYPQYISNTVAGSYGG
jgi:hypothetical protein